MIYNVAKHEENKDIAQKESVIEITLEDYDNISVANCIKILPRKDKNWSTEYCKIISGPHVFSTTDKQQCHFVIDMLMPSILFNLLHATQSNSTTEFMHVRISLICKGKKVCFFQHALTDSIHDLMLLEPLTWDREPCLAAINQTMHMVFDLNTLLQSQ